MKNLMIFISPTKSFNNPRTDLAANDFGVSVKVQIENSFDLGWKPKDIMLFTNFEFEYAGVKAKVLNDIDFFERKPQASKINAIIRLFENGTIKNNEIYWFHDLDAFQLCSTEGLKIDLGKADMALSDYGIADRWSTGVIYFKKSSKDIFEKIRDVTYKKNIDEERALTIITRTDKKISKRVKKINKSYNFTPKSTKLKSVYAKILKPVKVVHFHPLGKAWRGSNINAFDFLKGENSLETKFLPDRLINLFRYHRVI